MNVNAILNYLDLEHKIMFLGEFKSALQRQNDGEVDEAYVANLLEEWFATAEVLSIPGFKETLEKYKNEPPKMTRAGKTWEDQCKEFGVDLVPEKLRIVCAWCKEVMQEGCMPVSHGICKKCKEECIKKK